MTPNNRPCGMWDRLCGPSGRRMAPSARPSDALRRAAEATGTAACQGFRTASRAPRDVPGYSQAAPRTALESIPIRIAQ
jgi:hypothetical protein